jgi:heme A synthase
VERLATLAGKTPVIAEGGPARTRFTRFAWGVLAYNIFVVLWGAFVRATGSGAGCGSHWPLCNGEVVPRAPAAETIIEFTHRITSGLALIGVVVLVVWAYRLFPKGDRVRLFAVLSLVFILVEAALGAGLVLFEYVASNASVGRAVYLSAHLVNTQILLGMLAVTAWLSRPSAPSSPGAIRSPLLSGSLLVFLVVGVSGAIAALGDTLFPAASVAEGVRQDFDSAAHFLLRLRTLHPLLAVLAAIYVSFAVLQVAKSKISAVATRIAWWTWGFVALQLVIGAINIVLLAPVWMQLVHLLIADVLWILLVLMAVEGSRPDRELRRTSGF